MGALILRPIAVAVAALLILLPLGPAPADRAKALIGARRFDEAVGVLRPLVRGERVDAGLLFLFGLAAIEAAQRPGVSGDARGSLLDEAIAAFHTMLVKRPGLIRVRLELARAFFIKDEDRLAKQHFEQVLAGKPPSGVALNVNRFLAEIRARKRWSLRVGAAVAPDSNIGVGSDERIIYIDVAGQRLPFRRDQEELTSSGIGISAWAGDEYQYPLCSFPRRTRHLRTGSQGQ